MITTAINPIAITPIIIAVLSFGDGASEGGCNVVEGEVILVSSGPGICNEKVY